MRASRRSGRGRRIFLLLCLLIVGELAGAIPSLAALPSISDLPSLHALPSSPDRTGAGHRGAERSLSTELDRLERRLVRAEADGREILSYHAEHVAPLVSSLEPHIRDHREVLPRVVLALVREGHHVGVDPRLLGGVLLIENPWLDATIRSPVGAIGIMQVMPFHAGGWGCAGADPTHIETNVCHGTRILADALRSTAGDLDAALLLYNGCREGLNTPDCHDYPRRVQAHVGSYAAADAAGR